MLPLSWRAAADFRDQSGGGAEDDDSAAEADLEWAQEALTLSSRHPKVKHAVRLAFSGGQRFYVEGSTVRCETHLASQEAARILVEVAPRFDPAFAHELPPSAGTDPKTWRDACARLETGSSQLGLAWERAAADIEALQLGDGEGEEGFVPAAGSPHYIGLFGRDVLMTALQTLALNPATARGALGLVGGWTADRYDPDRDAQPGRVLHQRQLGPWALTGKTPFLRYWGDHSASGLFLLCLAQTFAHDGDAGRFRSHRDLALRVLEWMDRDGDLDGDGLYEYRTLAGDKGLKNQGWKDSRDAILYPDGKIASDPLAVCEVQGLFYAAKRAMGACFRAVGDDELGER
ncbi:MAG: hypothetical protein ACRDL8_20540, partial [Solirubrobacteraceae bacterium]